MRRRQSSTGILINLEVDDVDADYARLVERGTREPLLTLRSEELGQRHFIVAGPDGVMIDVITPVPPAASDQDAFDATSLPSS